MVFLKRHNWADMTPRTTPHLSRRHALAAACGTLLAPVVPGCGWVQDLPLAVAAHVWVGYEPMFLARERGWLDGDQVKLHETRSAIESIGALRAGTVQAAALTLDELLGARASGLALSAVLVFNVSMGADMLLVRPGITELAQLQGLRIGYEASSVAEVMLAEILKAAGLTRQQVHLEKIPVDEQVKSLQHHAVDAFITYEPVATQLLARGMARLFDSHQIPDTIIDVLAVHQDALDAAHSKALEHGIAAHFRALDELTRNPQPARCRLPHGLAPEPAGTKCIGSLQGPELAHTGQQLPNAGRQHPWFAASRASGGRHFAAQWPVGQGR